MLKKVRDKSGYTLLELVVVLIILAIIAGLAVPAIDTLLENSRIKLTEDNLLELKKAIIGDPSVGFVGFQQDMNRNPNPLSELWDQSASPSNFFTGLGTGTRIYVDQNAGSDAWKNSIVIVDPTGSAYLRSYGPDGIDDSGGNDDIELTVPQPS